MERCKKSILAVVIGFLMITHVSKPSETALIAYNAWKNEIGIMTGKAMVIALAVRDGNVDFFKRSQRIENINTVLGERGGWRPLMLAVRFNQKPIIEEMLKNPKLQIDETDWAGWTALMHAAKEGKAEIVKLLLPKADVLKIDLSGKTPLIWAVSSGNLETVREIMNDVRMTLEAINAKDKAGKSALGYAQEKGNAAITDLLKSKGAQ